MNFNDLPRKKSTIEKQTIPNTNTRRNTRNTASNVHSCNVCGFTSKTSLVEIDNNSDTFFLVVWRVQFTVRVPVRILAVVASKAGTNVVGSQSKSLTHLTGPRTLASPICFGEWTQMQQLIQLGYPGPRGDRGNAVSVNQSFSKTMSLARPRHQANQLNVLLLSPCFRAVVSKTLMIRFQNLVTQVPANRVTHSLSPCFRPVLSKQWIDFRN